MIASGPSNVLWSPDENVSESINSSTSAGQAIVGASEEVLCWDIKKGELVGRWKDQSCNAEVTIIAKSKADPDVYAVG